MSIEIIIDIYSLINYKFQITNKFKYRNSKFKTSLAQSAKCKANSN